MDIPAPLASDITWITEGVMTSGKMTIGQALTAELQHEAAGTRSMLSRVPREKFGWKPHEKSMPLGTLAVHIVEMIDWARLIVTTVELDYAVNPYEPLQAKTTADLLAYFDKTVQGVIGPLQETADTAMLATWTMRNGEHVYFQKPRIQVLRSDCFNHIIHHRGQLSVYLRLNDIRLPGVYGPTADD